MSHYSDSYAYTAAIRAEEIHEKNLESIKAFIRVHNKNHRDIDNLMYIMDNFEDVVGFINLIRKHEK